MRFRAVFTFAVLLFLTSAAGAEEGPREVEIVLSGAQSMNEANGGLGRLESVRLAFQKISNDLRPGAKVALRAFGSAVPAEDAAQACKDSHLILAMKPMDPKDMLARVFLLQPKGSAPAAYALEEAAKDFSKGASKTILLVTGSGDSCSGKLAETAQNLKKADASVKIDVLGLGLQEETKKEYDEICKITGGRCEQARDAGELALKLKAMMKEAGLLRERELKFKNLLAQKEGGEVLSSDSEEFAKLIDGKEEKTGAFFGGEKAVFAFQSHRPVMLESFSVAVPEEDPENPGTIELMGSLDSPVQGFYPVQVIQAANRVSQESIYQEFKISPPLPVRFLKAIVGPGASGGISYQREWAVSGKELDEKELVKYYGQIRNRVRNLLALENGGRVVSATYPEFYFLNDGTLAGDGHLAHLPVGSEAVFGFEGGRTALIQKITVPVLKPGAKNPKKIRFWASEKGSEAGKDFKDAGTFEVPDTAPDGTFNREFVFKEPVRAKYLKVSPAASNGAADMQVEIPEMRAFGTLE